MLKAYKLTKYSNLVIDGDMVPEKPLDAKLLHNQIFPKWFWQKI